jgi:hypothetical protein
MLRYRVNVRYLVPLLNSNVIYIQKRYCYGHCLQDNNTPPSILTKRTITSQSITQIIKHKKTTIYDNGNSGPLGTKMWRC